VLLTLSEIFNKLISVLFLRLIVVPLDAVTDMT